MREGTGVGGGRVGTVGVKTIDEFNCFTSPCSRLILETGNHVLSANLETQIFLLLEKRKYHFRE